MVSFDRGLWLALVFLSIFLLASPSACAKKVKADDSIVLERGDLDHQLYLSYTTTEGKRLSGVRLDEGPFMRGDLFVFDGRAYEFTSYEQEGDVIRLIFSSSTGLKNFSLSRYCDPDTTCLNMQFQPFRVAALTDAMDDDNNLCFEDDFELSLDPEDLYLGLGAGGVIWFDDSSNAVFFATDLDDRVVTIEPSMVGSVDLGGYALRAVREADFYYDLESRYYNMSLDLNLDSERYTYLNGNDDDLLIVFGSDGEDVVVDFSDRGYDEFVGGGYLYKNGVGIYSSFGFVGEENQANLVAEGGDDLTTRLFSPLSHVKYMIDWGVDNRLDKVSFTPK